MPVLNRDSGDSRKPPDRGPQKPPATRKQTYGGPAWTANMPKSPATYVPPIALARSRSKTTQTTPRKPNVGVRAAMLRKRIGVKREGPLTSAVGDQAFRSGAKGQGVYRADAARNAQARINVKRDGVTSGPPSVGKSPKRGPSTAPRFKPDVKLDPSQVRRGPNPSPRARAVASPNARFNRPAKVQASALRSKPGQRRKASSTAGKIQNMSRNANIGAIGTLGGAGAKATGLARMALRSALGPAAARAMVPGALNATKNAVSDAAKAADKRQALEAARSRFARMRKYRMGQRFKSKRSGANAK